MKTSAEFRTEVQYDHSWFRTKNHFSPQLELQKQAIHEGLAAAGISLTSNDQEVTEEMEKIFHETRAEFMNDPEMSPDAAKKFADREAA